MLERLQLKIIKEAILHQQFIPSQQFRFETRYFDIYCVKIQEYCTCFTVMTCQQRMKYTQPHTQRSLWTYHSIKIINRVTKLQSIGKNFGVIYSIIIASLQLPTWRLSLLSSGCLFSTNVQTILVLFLFSLHYCFSSCHSIRYFFLTFLSILETFARFCNPFLTLLFSLPTTPLLFLLSVRFLHSLIRNSSCQYIFYQLLLSLVLPLLYFLINQNCSLVYNPLYLIYICSIFHSNIEFSYIVYW